MLNVVRGRSDSKVLTAFAQMRWFLFAASPYCYSKKRAAHNHNIHSSKTVVVVDIESRSKSARKKTPTNRGEKTKQKKVAVSSAHEGKNFLSRACARTKVYYFNGAGFCHEIVRHFFVPPDGERLFSSASASANGDHHHHHPDPELSKPITLIPNS